MTKAQFNEIIKKVHFQHYPTHMITNYEADKLIEAFSEEVIYKMLSENVGKNVD